MTRKNQIIATIALIVIIVLGIGGYLLYGQNSKLTNNSTTQAPAPTKNPSLEASITDLFTSGQSKICTFDTKTDKGETSGTVYVTKDMAKADFTMTDNGKSTATHLIRNGNLFYIWGDSFPTGIKMTMDVNEMASKMNSTNYAAFNPNDKVSYSCKDWSVDNSMFTVPANLKFTDLSSMMPKTTGTIMPTGTEKQTQTNPCATISDATAKAACESALKNQGY